MATDAAEFTVRFTDGSSRTYMAKGYSIREGMLVIRLRVGSAVVAAGKWTWVEGGMEEA